MLSRPLLRALPRVAARAATPLAAATARRSGAAAAIATRHFLSSAMRMAGPMPEKAENDALEAKGKALEKQADTGLGATPIVGEVTSPPGTIDVTIGGERGYEEGAVPSLNRKDNDWTMSHPIWKGESAMKVRYTHMPPKDNLDLLAMWTIKTIRFNFDWMSGYTFGKLTEKKAITRICFLETVAGVPGSVGALIRHLASLRRMKRDGGWINTLMAEAENERMHLLTALEIRQPGPFMKFMVFLTQGVFFNFFFIGYLLSPRFCHRVVGYLEEEAVVTYTHILQSIDNNGELKGWATQKAPEIARTYWSLPEDATMRDVIVMIRADEAHHRDVNHTLASIPQDALNPFRSK